MKKKVQAATRHLKQVDATLKKLIDRHGACTLFDNNGLLHRSDFHVLIWAIINQQLSVKSARAIENKLLFKLSTDNFNQKSIDALSDNELAGCGLSKQKIRYIRALCQASQTRSIPLERMHEMDNKQVSDSLIQLPGIGPWTVDMFLMFSLGRLDVLPLGDLALRKSFSQHYSLPENPSTDDYLSIARCWHPYESIASWYLWAAVD
ncbi:MAG: DNA-3-methyladenine glycosylase 2 family protein [Gammaproteobacteria bacterium]|nr:DNA-3-methyladenine glycosylase 2 family protein [Gammaproteobacteria bacterium]